MSLIAVPPIARMAMLNYDLGQFWPAQLFAKGPGLRFINPHQGAFDGKAAIHA